MTRRCRTILCPGCSTLRLHWCGGRCRACHERDVIQPMRKRLKAAKRKCKQEFSK